MAGQRNASLARGVKGVKGMTSRLQQNPGAKAKPPRMSLALTTNLRNAHRWGEQDARVSVETGRLGLIGI